MCEQVLPSISLPGPLHCSVLCSPGAGACSQEALPPPAWSAEFS